MTSLTHEEIRTESNNRLSLKLKSSRDAPLRAMPLQTTESGRSSRRGQAGPAFVGGVVVGLAFRFTQVLECAAGTRNYQKQEPTLNRERTPSHYPCAHRQKPTAREGVLKASCWMRSSSGSDRRTVASSRSIARNAPTSGSGKARNALWSKGSPSVRRRRKTRSHR